MRSRMHAPCTRACTHACMHACTCACAHARVDSVQLDSVDLTGNGMTSVGAEAISRMLQNNTSLQVSKTQKSAAEKI